MDPRPSSAIAESLTTRAQIERIGEPWALNRSFAIACTFILAMIFGTWIGSGNFESLLLVVVGLSAAAVIIFVRDYWWAPPLVLTALSIGTTAAGFPIGGMEIGLVILALTFPVKIAMKTLRKAEPEMKPSFYYWALLGFVLVDCIVILFYSKIQGLPLKNIEKSYYQTIAPLILYGLLIRYCHVRTIRPTAIAIFFASLLVIPISAVVVLQGLSFDPFPDLHITFGFLDADSAIGLLRSAGPVLFTGCLAFWPTARTSREKLLLALGVIISLGGTVAAGGRLAVLCCLIAGIFFAFVRRKLWIAVPFALFSALISATISLNPDLYTSLPYLIQRSTAPLNFSTAGEDANLEEEGSNSWHKTIRDRSLVYWLQDAGSFWIGHGFKSWDPSISKGAEMGNVDIDHRIQLAVEMGYTENMFSSITNIYGVAGLVLYGAFLLHLMQMLFKGSKLSPPGSDARAFCEFSLVNLLPAIFLSPFMGYIPSLNLIYWGIGILAARPYLGLKGTAPDVPPPAQVIPAFARPAFASQVTRAPRQLHSDRV